MVEVMTSNITFLIIHVHECLYKELEFIHINIIRSHERMPLPLYIIHNTRPIERLNYVGCGPVLA